MKYPWLDIAHELQSIAQSGLTFGENKYDVERYEQILNLSKKILADFTDADFEKVSGLLDNEVGYLTPKVDVRGVVFKDDKILMVKETIDDCWSLPGGWADVGLSPRESVEKELLEEAGIEVFSERLLAVMDKKFHQHPPDVNYVYKLFILCSAKDHNIKTGMETSDVDYFSQTNLPTLSEPRNTINQINKMFELKDQPDEHVYFD